MAEPDGNPPPSRPLLPLERAAPASSEQPAALTPAPRVNPPSVFNQKDAPAPAPAAPAGFNDFLAWIQTLAGAQTPPPPPPAVAASRGTLPRSEKKFHRQDSETSRKNPGSETPVPPSPESGVVDHTPPAWNEPRDADPTTSVRKRRLKPPSVTSVRTYRGWLNRLLQLALLIGVFVLGRATASKNRPSPVASSSSRASVDRPDLDPPTADLINQAMAAEGRGDYARAAGLLEQVPHERTHVSGLDYHLAVLAYEAGDSPRALILLNRSLEKGENVAACYQLRGTLNNRITGVGRGLDELAAATQADPFEAKYFFSLGEALRRGGKPQAALQQLQLALDRQRDPTQESIYQLKIRLAQIELGRQDEFKTQLAAELGRHPPTLDWVLTAAAAEMHAGRFDAAAEYLDRASILTDQETLTARLRDYFFYGFAKEKALARFYSPAARPNAPAATAATTAYPPAPPPPAPAEAAVADDPTVRGR